MTSLFGYLCAVNVLAFIMYGDDKRAAQQGKWRIPEKMLIGIAFLGGGLGAFAGMKVFHHKTKHIQFKISIPLACIIWITGIVVLLIFRLRGA